MTRKINQPSSMGRIARNRTMMILKKSLMKIGENIFH